MLPRRKFIYQMGAIAGASMLPACANYASNTSKEGVTVRVVFVSNYEDVQISHGWPGRNYDYRPEKKNIINALNAQIPDVNFISSFAGNEDEAAAIVEKDGDEIAGYMVIQMSNWVMSINGVLHSDKPLLFYTRPYEGDGGWLSRTTGILWDHRPHFAFVASFNFMDVIKAASAFSKLNGGNVDDFDVESERIRKEIIPTECKAVAKEDNLKCLSAQETLSKIKGTKIVVLGEEDRKKADEVKQSFGMDVVFVGFEEFNKIFDSINDGDARTVADKWKSDALALNDTTDKDIFLSAKTYLSSKVLLDKYAATAITIDCLGGFYSGQIKGYPCLGFKQLQDDGYMGVCEADLSSTSTMLALGAMTGRVGYVSDPVLDFSTRSIIYAHCVCTTKFFGPNGPSSPYEIITHAEDRNGASVRTIAPVGYPVTSVIFDLRFREMCIHKGIITGNSFDDRACRTKIVAEVQGDYDKIFRHWQAWHRCTFIGDFTKEAEEFAKLIGYTIINEC